MTAAAPAKEGIGAAASGRSDHLPEAEKFLSKALSLVKAYDLPAGDFRDGRSSSGQSLKDVREALERVEKGFAKHGTVPGASTWKSDAAKHVAELKKIEATRAEALVARAGTTPATAAAYDTWSRDFRAAELVSQGILTLKKPADAEVDALMKVLFLNLGVPEKSARDGKGKAKGSTGEPGTK